jgi:diphthamide synthase (EF-2-diphthine--ammonia ligase)
LSDLPADVDPCGENGEFHSFVYDGPIFRERVLFTKGEIVLRDNRFYYCDLVPVSQ